MTDLVLHALHFRDSVAETVVEPEETTTTIILEEGYLGCSIRSYPAVAPRTTATATAAARTQVPTAAAAVAVRVAPPIHGATLPTRVRTGIGVADGGRAVVVVTALCQAAGRTSTDEHQFTSANVCLVAHDRSMYALHI